ncbi:MAG: sigma-70 factor domain-containing protein [Bdellovibrionota bacterium]
MAIRPTKKLKEPLKPKTPEVLPGEEEEPEEPGSESEEDDDSGAYLPATALSRDSDRDRDRDALETPVTVAEPQFPATTGGASEPLRRYMHELKQHPLLTPEEEFKLAMKLKETGDVQAARALVAANLRLVVKISFEYRTIYQNVMDLIQEGNI